MDKATALNIVNRIREARQRDGRIVFILSDDAACELVAGVPIVGIPTPAEMKANQAREVGAIMEPIIEVLMSKVDTGQYSAGVDVKDLPIPANFKIPEHIIFEHVKEAVGKSGWFLKRESGHQGAYWYISQTQGQQ